MFQPLVDSPRADAGALRGRIRRDHPDFGHTSRAPGPD